MPNTPITQPIHQKVKTYDPSSIGKQLAPYYYYRKALRDLKPDQHFGQLASTINMPKHFGKTLKRDYYIPVLDDRNVNDQGIDATGSVVTDKVTIIITDPDGMSRYAIGKGNDGPTALVAAKLKAEDVFKNAGVFLTSYAVTKAALIAAGWTVEEGEAVNGMGNMYASYLDIGVQRDMLPALSENGGQVNRVGHTRITQEASIESFGFYEEYTKDSVQFDSDADSRMHINRETLTAANTIVEDCLQFDLLNGGNVVYYGGDATSMATLTGEAGVVQSVLDYRLFLKLENTLNKNRCPKDTKIIDGSRMADTRTVSASRYCFIGSELVESLEKIVDFHGKKAFIPVHQYANAGKVAAGEIGTIRGFRVIENMRMQHWAGMGADVVDNDGFLESNGKYNVYPLLVVGSESFNTIGFQTSGENTKFKIIHKEPGEDTASPYDPYGLKGFYSIQWWYGILITRPEWIACVKVIAEQ